MFKIIGAAAAAANLLCEFRIAEKKDAKQMKNKKGKVILVKFTATVIFSKSPIKRTGRNRFIRNILIGIGNSKDTSLIDIVKQLTRDKSLIVSKTAQWALKRLNQIKIHPAKKSLN